MWHSVLRSWHAVGQSFASESGSRLGWSQAPSPVFTVCLPTRRGASGNGTARGLHKTLDQSGRSFQERCSRQRPASQWLAPGPAALGRAPGAILRAQRKGVPVGHDSKPFAMLVLPHERFAGRDSAGRAYAWGSISGEDWLPLARTRD